MTSRASPRPTARRRRARRPITRDALEAGRVDFFAIDGGKRLAPVPPGDVLRHEFLEPLGLSAPALARALKVPANRLSAIVAGRRTVTAETALRLARHFGTTAGFWLTLQKAYELELAEREAGARIRAEVAPRAAA